VTNLKKIGTSGFWFCGGWVMVISLLTHGWQERHTTFDLWHLAAAWSLSAGAFLTFDQRQGRIAGLMGMSR